MKKALIVLLSLCLMGSALAAAPSEDEAAEAAPEAVEQIIDLSGYDDDALVALLKQVQSEIVDRKIEKTAPLRAGTYVFGEDIPVGKYVLKKEQNDQAGIVSLAAADDEEGEYPSKLYEFIGEEAHEMYITGEEGDVLTLPFSCDLIIFAGVTFE